MTIFRSSALVTAALLSAMPLIAATPPDTKAPPQVSKPAPVKKPHKPNNRECTYEETGKQVCHDNEHGDKECVAEIVEHCPQPL